MKWVGVESPTTFLQSMVSAHDGKMSHAVLVGIIPIAVFSRVLYARWQNNDAPEGLVVISGGIAERR